MKTTVLKVNPIVTSQHYQYYFDCPERTAQRYHKRDKEIDKLRHITFGHFYNLYGGFPDPKFKPVFVEIDLPPNTTIAANNANAGIS